MDETVEQVNRFRGIITSVILIFLFACSSEEKEKDICYFKKPCIKKTGNVEVMLDIEPKPLQTLRETEFIVTISGSDKIPDKLLLDLTMPGMFMGKNQVILKKIDKNKYSGKGIIPRCPSGKTLWQADIFIPEEGTVSFRFNVK